MSATETNRNLNGTKLIQKLIPIKICDVKVYKVQSINVKIRIYKKLWYRLQFRF